MLYYAFKFTLCDIACSPILASLLHANSTFNPNADTGAAGHRKAVASLLSVFPSVHSRFITWDSESECAQPPTTQPDWHWRKQCIYSIIALGVWSQRYVVLPDRLPFSNVYNVNQLSNWFPILLESRFSALMRTAFQNRVHVTVMGVNVTADGDTTVHANETGFNTGISVADVKRILR